MIRETADKHAAQEEAADGSRIRYCCLKGLNHSCNGFPTALSFSANEEILSLSIGMRQICKEIHSKFNTQNLRLPIEMKKKLYPLHIWEDIRYSCNEIYVIKLFATAMTNLEGLFAV